MTQHKFYVADLKLLEYKKMSEEKRREINRKLQKQFYRELDKEKQ